MANMKFYNIDMRTVESAKRMHDVIEHLRLCGVPQDDVPKMLLAIADIDVEHAPLVVRLLTKLGPTTFVKRAKAMTRTVWKDAKTPVPALEEGANPVESCINLVKSQALMIPILVEAFGARVRSLNSVLAAVDAKTVELPAEVVGIATHMRDLFKECASQLHYVICAECAAKAELEAEAEEIAEQHAAHAAHHPPTKDAVN